jgi:alternate signal-mediated exported protein
MKRKILAGIMVIALIVVAMVGGTLAWFTDADATPENTFQAGTLSMDVNDIFPYEDKTFDNFEPGTSVPKSIYVTNNGTKREFLRALVTETLTQKLHFYNDQLVQYLPAYDSGGKSTGVAGTFAAKLTGGQYIIEYDVNGRPVLFNSQAGFVEVYVVQYDSDGSITTSLVQKAYPAGDKDTFLNGTLPGSAVPAVRYADYNNTLSSLVSVSGFGVYMELVEDNWKKTILNGRDTTAADFEGSGFEQIEWYYDHDNDPLTPKVEFDSSNLYTQLSDKYYYFNKALYPAGYDGTPADGNDGAALATVAPFLSDVMFVSTALDNIYQGSVYQLQISFETIQVTNGAAADAWGATFSVDLEEDLTADVTGSWSE